MEFSVATDFEQLAAGANLTLDQVHHILQLLDAGYSIPYLVRYRGAEVGNLDEERLGTLRRQIHAARQLSDRKVAVLRTVDHQGQLTPALESAIRSAPSLRVLEDLNLPFRRRKRAKEWHVRRESLASLVRTIVDATQGVDVPSALQGIAEGTGPEASLAEWSAELRQLIAEHFLYDHSIRQAIRETIEKHGALVSRHFVESADLEDRTEPAQEAQGAEWNGSAVGHQDVPSSQEPADSPPRAESAGGSDRETDRVSLPAEGPLAGFVHPRPAPSESIAQLRREQRREARRKRRRRLESSYRSFFQFRKNLPRISPCEWAGLDRGERLRVLEIHYEVGVEPLMAACGPLVAADDHPRRDVILDALREALPAEIPILAKELQRDLVAASEMRWQEGQRRKLQRLLLRHPMPAVVLAIEPQIRRESTVVVLDPHGKIVAQAMLWLAKEPHGPESQQQLAELIAHHQVRYLVLGDSPGFREIYPWLASIQDQLHETNPFELALVRSAGTGIFARSAAAARELGSHPDNVRRAVSLGRRFQQPLQEYTRLDIGRAARLLFGEETKSEAYDEFIVDAVRSCVARRGVDVNQAEESLLRFVPAMNTSYAQRLVQARKELGGFPDRQSILRVEGIDGQALQQAVAFLRVGSSANPFDATSVHPDDEPLARQILESGGLTEEDLRTALPALDAGGTGGPAVDPPSAAEPWHQRLRMLDLDRLADAIQVDRQRLAAVRDRLAESVRDPAGDLPLPPTRIGPIQFELLQTWDQVVGIVANLVPFGAFVDLGDKLIGLLHVSRIAEHYVADPREIVDEGEQLLLWVTEVVKEKGRIALSLIPPRERTHRPRHGKPTREARTAQRTPPASRPIRDKASRPPRQFGKRPTQPVVPITEAMKAGTEPMRTFSDLAQFFEHQKKGDQPGHRTRNQDQHD